MRDILRSTALWMLLLIALPVVVMAHAPEQSYLYLRIYEEKVNGTVEITSDDLNTALGLSLERGMSAAEMATYVDRIQRYILQRVKIYDEGKQLRFVFTDYNVLPVRSVGDFWRFNFDLEGISLRIKNLQVEAGKIALIAEANVTQIPSA